MAYSAEKAFELVSAAHERGRLAHAFLISGADGSGKQELAARIIRHVNGGGEKSGSDLFGEAVKVETPPLDDLESGWVRILRPRMKSRRIGVDEIRNLEHTLQLAAPKGEHKVGVLVEVSADQGGTAAKEEFQSMIKDITLHIAAANPKGLSREDIPADVVEKEKEVFRGQLANEAKPKPAEIIEKIIEGKIGKYFAESCLLEQAFVKDPDTTVGKLVETTGKQVGDTLVVRRFVRFGLGE